MAIVAYTGEMKTAVCKTRRVCTFRKHTAAQHARFLASGDTQEEFDELYSALLQLMDEYYPERLVTITSGDPAYVTLAVKHMLRQKNKLMQSGRVEKAAALAIKIGVSIQSFNSAEMSCGDVYCSQYVKQGTAAHRAHAVREAEDTIRMFLQIC